MEDPKLVAASTIALAVTLFAILSMRPLARRLGLVDKPDDRKLHRGHIPLIGGLCFFLGTLVGLSYLGYLDRFATSLVAGGALIVLIGVVDDFDDLSVRSRLLAEAGVVALVILASGYYVDDLGPLLGGHTLRLGLLGIPLTIVAVIGLINAFNMLDGIDGLAASMAMVSIAAILFFDQSGWSVPSVLLLLQVLFAALIPYLFVNLGWPDGRKVFMGDAGSTLIGFLLAWSLVFLSHRSVARLAPVDVLWCVAFPVMDTLAVMYRRMRKGYSPFKPDRQHLHHLLLDAGYPPRMALIAIIAASGLLALLGYVLRNAPDAVSAAAFAAALVFYVFWLPPSLALLRLPWRLRAPDAEGAVAVTVGGLMLEQPWDPRDELDDADDDGAPGTAGRASQGAMEQRPPLKTLCVLAAPSDTVQIAPIAQQLSQDERFEPTLCVAAASAQGTEDALNLFDLQADHKVDVDGMGRDSTGMTSAAIGGMKLVLNEVQPDMVLVPADTAASLATALVAYCHQIPVVCIDTEPMAAGSALPGARDEASRKLVRTLASLHVTPNASAGRHLIDEGVPAERILVAGDAPAVAADDGSIEVDACHRILEALASLGPAPDLAVVPPHYVDTQAAPAMRSIGETP